MDRLCLSLDGKPEWFPGLFAKKCVPVRVSSSIPVPSVEVKMLKWLRRQIHQSICYHSNCWYTFDIDWNNRVDVFKCKLCDLVQTKFYTRPDRVCHTGDHLLSECPGDHGK